MWIKAEQDNSGLRCQDARARAESVLPAGVYDATVGVYAIAMYGAPLTELFRLGVTRLWSMVLLDHALWQGAQDPWQVCLRRVGRHVIVHDP